MCESSDTPSNLAKISFLYPPHTDKSRNSLEFRDLSVLFGWWYAVYNAALYGVYFALFSYLAVSVSILSVWHIINKSSRICAHFQFSSTVHS